MYSRRSLYTFDRAFRAAILLSCQVIQIVVVFGSESFSRLTQTLGRCIERLGLEYYLTQTNIRPMSDFDFASPSDQPFFQLLVVGNLAPRRFASKMVYWIVISCSLNKK